MADNFVDRVVPADVFAHVDERAAGAEQGGGMQPAGPVEHGLDPAEHSGKVRKKGRADTDVASRRSDAVDAHSADGRFSTDAAARGGVEMPLQPGDIHRPARVQRDIDHVPARAAIRTAPVVDSSDVVAVEDDSFGEQEPGRELEIVTRRPHGDADRDAIQADFQRLFDREIIVDPAFAACMPLDNGRSLDAASGWRMDSGPGARGGSLHARPGVQCVLPAAGRSGNYLSNPPAIAALRASRRTKSRENPAMCCEPRKAWSPTERSVPEPAA